MQILALNSTVEGTQQLAGRIKSIGDREIDSLNIKVGLATLDNYQTSVGNANILVIGIEVSHRRFEIITKSLELNPNIEIILFLSDTEYQSQSFRSDDLTKIRKILPYGCSVLDILQEFVSVHLNLKKNGVVSTGKLVTITQSKGGVGASTIAAGFAELCAQNGLKTLVWDFDIESQDLSRSLGGGVPNGTVFKDSVNGLNEFNRTAFESLLFNINDSLAVLAPPTELSVALDFINNPDCMDLIEQILSYARTSFDVIIVDTVGRISSSTGFLLHKSDANLIVIDDSVLGLASVPSFMKMIEPLIINRVGTNHFIRSGTKIKAEKISKLIAQSDKHSMLHQVLSNSCLLPALELDSAANEWPASGNTLYSIGSKHNKKVFEIYAQEMGLVESFAPISNSAMQPNYKQRHNFFQNLSEKLSERIVSLV